MGQELSRPLINLIAFHPLDPSLNKNMLNVYEVGSIDWYYKYLYVINMELMHINQHSGLVQPMALTGAVASSAYDCRWQTITLPHKIKT